MWPWVYPCLSGIIPKWCLSKTKVVQWCSIHLRFHRARAKALCLPKLPSGASAVFLGGREDQRITTTTRTMCFCALIWLDGFVCRILWFHEKCLNGDSIVSWDFGLTGAAGFSPAVALPMARSSISWAVTMRRFRWSRNLGLFQSHP